MSDFITLGEVSDIKGGSGFPEVYQGLKSGDYPFIKVSDMNLLANSRYIFNANNYVNMETVQTLNLSIFPKDTLVFAKVGAAVYLNKRRLLTKKTIIDNNMMGITPRNIDSEFLYQVMLSIDLAEFVQPGALPSINQEIVSKISIPVFTLKQQKKIANILSTVDKLIENTQTLIDKYTDIKQGMIADLFARGIDLSFGPDGTTASNPNYGQLRPSVEDAPELYKETELGWVPSGWEVLSFGELADYKNGNSFSANDWKEEGHPIIRIQNLNGSNEYNYYTGALKENWHILPGDLLFAWSGQKGVSFGARIWNGPEGVLNQHIFKVYENSKILSRQFLFYLFKINVGRIEDNAHGFKDSFVHVTRSELTEVLVKVPEKNEQKIIEKRVIALEENIALEEADLNKHKAMKKGLMQDLLIGRVKVA